MSYRPPNDKLLPDIRSRVIRIESRLCRALQAIGVSPFADDNPFVRIRIEDRTVEIESINVAFSDVRRMLDAQRGKGKWRVEFQGKFVGEVDFDNLTYDYTE